MPIALPSSLEMVGHRPWRDLQRNASCNHHKNLSKLPTDGSLVIP
jgi:hypothetical protein